jgi:hypothetical protein
MKIDLTYKNYVGRVTFNLPKQIRIGMAETDEEIR